MWVDSFLPADTAQRFFAPEVVQTSELDCGPAALKCLLEGFGISVSYGRLREACQTDLDGTSIDTIEDVANQLGLEARQVMVPAEHLILPVSNNLPALVVVRLPNGLTHFVIVWRVHGRFVQVMDPSVGRRWQGRQQLYNQLYIHQHPILAETWRAWAGSDGFCLPLQQRLDELGLPETRIQSLLDMALTDPSWYAIARLDGATRMVNALVRAKGLLRGEEAAGVLSRFMRPLQSASSGINQSAGIDIPRPYWSVTPLPSRPDSPDYLLVQGVVLIQVIGRQKMPSPSDPNQASTTDRPVEVDSSVKPRSESTGPNLSPELLAALEEKSSHPLHDVLTLLAEDGLFAPSVLALALFVAAVGVIIEVILFRGITTLSYSLNFVEQRIEALIFIFIFFIILIILEIPIASMTLRLGRRLESRLRIKFLEKLPRLGDRYFHSRLTSDMAHRVHELRQLRLLPRLGVQGIRLAFELVLTATGIVLLSPNSAEIAILATLFAISLLFITQPIMTEQDLALRTHTGALSRFYLDALLGLMPIRTHSSEQSVRHQYESLLVKWIYASMKFYQSAVFIRAIQALFGAIFALWILIAYFAEGGEPSGVLLLFFWTLRLPALGQSMASLAQQYPSHRNRLLRLFEPLGAPEETEIFAETRTQSDLSEQSPEAVDSKADQSQNGLAIRMENVHVQAGGHLILTDINLTIAAGEEVAIVGPSGSGKSSLISLLLGWHRPHTGQVWVNDHLLKGKLLLDLRRQIAWVDPAVQLWNRSLLDNLNYGLKSHNIDTIGKVIEQADLFEVLENLPDSLQTSLGEGGGLLSGGEGQRVRLGRAMRRQGVRLVILDEPFRGLDRHKRRDLLKRARQYWQGATLLFISHDIEQTQDFARVLVIEDGKIVEDDAPQSLLRQPNSRYFALQQMEENVLRGIWQGGEWKRLWLENGKLNP